VEKERTMTSQDQAVAASQERDDVTKQSWEKPALDRFPLKEAQTGGAGSGDALIPGS
jgi:hypothetical protein